MAFSEERMDDFRADAIEELMLDDQYEEHEAHYGFPDPDCWLCTEAEEE